MEQRHLERRLFVLLHPNGRLTTHAALQHEAPVQTALWQNKRDSKRSVGIGHCRLTGHLLAVGIQQNHLHRTVGYRSRLFSLLTIVNTFQLHGLPRPIDGTVGE